jgi:sulfide:quinone oxidoreductase
MKILILGAGFGGLELATRLSDEIGDRAEIDVIDEKPGFVFGFSKLDVMFGKQTAEHVFHPYEAIHKAGVRFIQTTIRSIDPTQKSVVTDAGQFEADVLVVALGADLDPSATCSNRGTSSTRCLAPLPFGTSSSRSRGATSSSA